MAARTKPRPPAPVPDQAPAPAPPAVPDNPPPPRQRLPEFLDREQLSLSARNRPVERDAALEELRESIRRSGILQPLLVRLIGEGPAGRRFEVVAGARRLAASEGLVDELPCYVFRDLDELEAHELRLVENLQRRDLTPMQEAEALEGLLASGRSLEQAAGAIGKPLAYVARRRNLLNLSPAWRAVLSGRPLPRGKGRGSAWERTIGEEDDGEHPARSWGVELLELVATQPHDVQDEQLAEARRGVVPTRAQLRRELARRHADLGLAPWGLGDETLVPKAGSCAACRKRSDAAPAGLFDSLLDVAPRRDRAAAGALCLDLECWRGKLVAHAQAKIAAARAEHGDRLVLIARKPNYATLERDELVGLRDLKGAHVVHSHHVRGAKKGAASARPGLQLSGDFSVRWVTLGPGPESASGGERGKRAAKAREATPAERRKAARARVAGRRSAWVLDQVVAQLEKLELQGGEVHRAAALKLLAEKCLGGGSTHWNGRAYGGDSSAVNRGRLAAWKAATRETVERDLWCKITRPRLLAVLNRSGVTLDRLGGMLSLAGDVLPALGIDVAALERRAVEEVPEPRWLAAEKAEPTAKADAKGRRGSVKRSGKKAKGRARKS